MTSLVTGLPLDLRFRTKGQLAIDICAEAYADGVSFDFVCGDEVYGSSTQLREFLEDRGQAYVLRVASSFTGHARRRDEADLRAGGEQLVKGRRQWEVRSAGQGSKGRRWYAWALDRRPPPRAITCWSAATWPAASWPSTTATSPTASCSPSRG